MTTLLAVVLALALGWCWGHSTARIHIVPIGATAEQDDAELFAEDRALFDEITAALDVPDDPERTP